MAIPNQGKTRLLNILRNPSGYAVIPYTNAITPDASTVYSDMVLAPMQNYAFGINWQAPVIDGSNNATITSEPFTFVNWTAPFPFTVRGFFLHLNGTDLLKVVPFDDPIEITETSQEITRDISMKIPA